MLQMHQSGNQGQVHLLMMDVNMPEISGFELVRAAEVFLY